MTWLWMVNIEVLANIEDCHYCFHLLSEEWDRSDRCQRFRHQLVAQNLSYSVMRSAYRSRQRMMALIKVRTVDHHYAGPGAEDGLYCTSALSINLFSSLL
jgi:hypothetical protein